MIYLGIAMIILAVDLSAKYYIEHNRTSQQEDTILGNALIIRKHLNKGIVLNRLDHHTKLVKGISVIMTGFLAIIALYSFSHKKALPRSRRLGLSLLLGGALSNTYDRVFRGYVVDYFSFQTKWKKFSNIIFNIADLFIFIGSALIGFGQPDRKIKSKIKSEAAK